MGRLTPPRSGDGATAVSLFVLKDRSDFLKAAAANRAGAGSFFLQGRKRSENEKCIPAVIRVGFTCSKKVGNAVARNRAKRRLREIARHVIPLEGKAGWDYVLIGKAGSTETRDYNALTEDLKRALSNVHKGGKANHRRHK